MALERGLYKWDDEQKKLVKVEKARPRWVHAVITDEIPGGLESMVDGKIYTSKSGMRKHYRQAGVIEKGNDKAPGISNIRDEAYDRRLAEDAERAYYESRDNMAPLSELDRERCKIMDHNMEHYNYDRRFFDDDGNPRE